jgi:GDPmannose 4,6-dehydratase
MRTALITGITGQDGSFLTELLLEKGYEVHGIIRRASTDNRARIAHLADNDRLRLHYGDITDSLNLVAIVNLVKPDEVYNLASQSHVKTSFELPEYTAETAGIGALRVLEAARVTGLAEKCRIYQASTSELFGNANETPQTEATPFNPRSPYAAAKLYAYSVACNYREAYGMFVSNGIMYNHESERRDPSFVTRKITLAAARIALNLQRKLLLGNLNALRDWGYAKDYTECMWRILQHAKPDDFVIATGEQHSVREFCVLAFKYAGIDLSFEGEDVNERGIDKKSKRVLIEVSPELFRPTEVDSLLGNPAKARSALGWDPLKTSFASLVRIMVEHDLTIEKRNSGGGYGQGK